MEDLENEFSWVKPPEGGVNFTIPPVNNVADLYGDIYYPNLVIFSGGNQFMVLPEIMDAFTRAYPACKRFFYETLPPGIIDRQLKTGSLIVGNLKLTVRPDVFAAGQSRIEKLKSRGYVDRSVACFRNRLAILVYEGNPKAIESLDDLGADGIRLSMPDPEIEGIGEKIVRALRKAGGRSLARKVMEVKVKNGTCFITRIHHRQTPIRIIDQQSDAGVVWHTEALFQKSLGNPVDLVEIPETQNVVSTTTAARMREAIHSEAAENFLDFITAETARTIYRKYGFMPAG